MGTLARVVVALLAVLVVLDARAVERFYVPMAPPPDPPVAEHPGLAAGWRWVDEVVDGEVLRLRGVGREVRLAGIETPAACDGEAAAALRAIVRPGRVVQVEPAEVPTTPDGQRFLAYVRVPYGDDLWTAQEIMLQRGRARVVRTPPLWTQRYFGDFLRAEQVGRTRAAVDSCPT
jgi:endonuclease YncB( thermonuclease family)